jgi:hypothetical protein
VPTLKGGFRRVALFIASRAKERVSDSVSKEEVHARTGVCAVCV